MTIKAFLLLPAYFDYIATFLWAISGALLGARRGYAFLGIMTVSIVSSAGGGLLRDGLFLQDGAPVLLRSPTYLSIIAVSVLVVVLFGQRIQRLRHLHYAVSLVDAIGLGAYAVVGMNRALAAGLSLPGVIVVGMVNAVGGGILRDVLMRKEPSMFQPGTLDESLALIGCILFVMLIRILSYEQSQAAWITIAVVFAIRMIAIRYQIRTKPLRGFEKYWQKTESE
jgi:uncharacterized membrane protein YeiH